MTLSVYWPRDEYPEAVEVLQRRLSSDVQLHWGSAPPDRCDVLIAGRPDRDQLTASPDLQALVIPFAGLPQETRSLMLQFPHLAVHNLHHNAVAAAEMAVALMLASSKFIVPNDRALRENDWRSRYRPNPAVLLRARTVLILGYGAIGQQVAGACRGLGMTALATRRLATRGAGRDGPWVYRSLTW